VAGIEGADNEVGYADEPDGSQGQAIGAGLWRVKPFLGQILIDGG
jgi:hypothetical protein